MSTWRTSEGALARRGRGRRRPGGTQRLWAKNLGGAELRFATSTGPTWIEFSYAEKTALQATANRKKREYDAKGRSAKNAEADLANGVLTLRIPQSEASRPRSISIT